MVSPPLTRASVEHIVDRRDVDGVVPEPPTTFSTSDNDLSCHPDSPMWATAARVTMIGWQRGAERVGDGCDAGAALMVRRCSARAFIEGVVAASPLSSGARATRDVIVAGAADEMFYAALLDQGVIAHAHPPLG